MKTIRLSITISILIIGIVFSNASAESTLSSNLTLQDEHSCSQLGGSWNSINSMCTINASLTISSGYILAISNVVLEITNSGTIANFGTIYNYGTINNFGAVNNYSTINNNAGATINNHESIYNRGVINNTGNPPVVNAIINNDGLINNRGVINNNDGFINNNAEGVIINNNLESPIPEQGTINNYGIITNYGTINNTIDSTIQNAGTITNNCGSILENAGTITIIPVVIVPCDTTQPSIIAPPDISSISNVPLEVPIGMPVVNDDTDPSPIVTNNAPELFPIGITIVTWTATDHSGNSATATQMVTIKTPVQAIYDLVLLSNSMGVNTSMLENAHAILNDNNQNNDNGACGKLSAFINKVNADKIIQSQKDQLTQQANAIKSSIG